MSSYIIFHWKHREFLLLNSLPPRNVHSLYFLLSLQKIGFTSAIPSKLDCVRLALSLQKIGFASAIPSKLDCIRLALSLQKIGFAYLNMGNGVSFLKND